MKTKSQVSSSRRKSRAAYFNAPSHIRYKLMSANLSDELRKKHGIRSLPVRRDDTVKITRGNFSGTEGKVTTVYRRRWCLYIEKVTRTRKNGATVKIPINPSNC